MAGRVAKKKLNTQTVPANSNISGATPADRNSNIMLYMAGAVMLILLYLYITKPTQTNYAGGVINQTSTIAVQPYVRNLYSNYTITIPGYTNNTVFYNSTYGLYNNYTSDGEYNITFYAPYDGYLILYVQKTNAPILTYGFDSNSNASSYVYCYGGCQQYNLTSGIVASGISGFSDTPAVNATFYHFVPLLRGNETFIFQNGNEYPISITFSLTYVGDEYSNLTPLTINYSK